MRFVLFGEKSKTGQSVKFKDQYLFKAFSSTTRLMSNGKPRKVNSNLCVAAILCLAICSCVGKQQTISRDQQQATSQTTPLSEELPIPRGPFKHGFQVETKYDKFRDQTKVSLDCKVYYKGPFGLFLTVEGSYP